jgi:MoxR-like ATPase
MILEKGKLRERVKSGEVKAWDARQELLALKRAGQVVSEDAIRWLGNFDSRRRPSPVEEVAAEAKPRRKKSRRPRKERNADVS